MGLRKDFSVHKKKTIESFGLVRADISGISLEVESLKNIIASFGSRISAIDNELLNLSKNFSSNNLNISSKIDRIGSSMSDAIAAVNTLRNGISRISSSYQRMSKNMSGNKNVIKKLQLKSRNELLKSRKLSSALLKSQKDIKKIKNLLKRNSRSVKRADAEFEKKLRSQRRRIAQLNRKIEGKKVVRKAPKKIFKRIIKKKVTPKKTIKKTITPKRIVTETITPKRKTITEVKK